MKQEEIFLNSFYQPALRDAKYTQRHCEKDEEGEGKEGEGAGEREEKVTDQYPTWL